MVFGDMIADMIKNRKLNPMVKELFIAGTKIKHFNCFYYAIIFSIAKRCHTKFYALFHYGNSQ